MWIYFRPLTDDILLDCSSYSHLWPSSHWLINYSCNPPNSINSITVQGPMCGGRSLARCPFPLLSVRNSLFISTLITVRRSRGGMRKRNYNIHISKVGGGAQKLDAEKQLITHSSTRTYGSAELVRNCFRP